MPRPAIRVEHVSKRYRLGTAASYLRFSELLENGLRRIINPRRSREDAANSGWIWALRDVSFEVPTGELLGIIGRNGAGKTTLLKILSRITRPSRGRVGLCGRVGSLLEVGTGFHPELTGRENIFLNGAILGMSRREVREKFDEIVAFAEVAEFLDTPVKRYSSGMYVRLAFAVAAHLEPEILLVDEVLAVGDLAFQRKCLGKMSDVGRSGRTVLFVSHNMAAVSRLCTRALLIDEGRIIAEGAPRAVIERYLSSDQAPQRQRRWTADDGAGNDKIRLRSIALEPVGRPPECPLDVTTPFDIRVVYEKLVVDGQSNVGLYLTNAQGICLFNTVGPLESFGSGLISATVRIPGNLLNNGPHRVRVMILIDLIPQVDLDGVLNFDVQDIERSIAAVGEWTGAVRPQLDWRVERPRNHV